MASQRRMAPAMHARLEHCRAVVTSLGCLSSSTRVCVWPGHSLSHHFDGLQLNISARQAHTRSPSYHRPPLTSFGIAVSASQRIIMRHTHTSVALSEKPTCLSCIKMKHPAQAGAATQHNQTQSNQHSTKTITALPTRTVAVQTVAACGSNRMMHCAMPAINTLPACLWACSCSMLHDHSRQYHLQLEQPAASTQYTCTTRAASRI